MVKRAVATVAVMLLAAVPAQAASISFSDNFTGGPSTLWSNSSGNWTAPSGTYYAQNPTNSPTTHTLLPYDLTDFDFSVDVNSASDGGIWLRSDANRSNALLLVIGGNGHTGTGFYFHQVVGGGFGSPVGGVSGLFAQGANINVHVNVAGNTYTVYLNGSGTPATSFTWGGGPASGFVGLYDFGCCSNGNITPGLQSFDNVNLRGTTVDPAAVPEPATLVLLGAGLLGIVTVVRRRRNS